MRSLVSGLAGGLVVVGGWLGWAHAGTVDAALSGAGSTTTAAAAPSPRSTCPIPGPTGAEGMDALMRRLDLEPTLQGGDHGASVALADGRRLFTFGDTVRDPDAVSPVMVRNSLLVADGSCLHPVIGRDGGAVIPDHGATGFWPMSLHATPHDNRGTTVQILASGVRSTGAGMEDFETTGSHLVTFAVPAGGTPRLVSRVPLGPATSDPRVPSWGAAMWDDGDWLYVFGTASTADKSTAGWALHVARTRPSGLGDTASWEYWDGSSWVSGSPVAALGERGELIGADGGVSHVLSVIHRDGTWYAISKEGDYHGEWLTVWSAPEVTGPWTPHRVRPLAGDASTLRYAVLAHPDLETASGRLVVSWSEAPPRAADVRTHPERYRPRFAEVELP